MLDKNGKGFLTAADMRPFGEQTGFNGSLQEWQEEFQLLCRERGSSQGLPLDGFVSMVNDPSDEGCYCENSELRNLLSRWQTAQTTLSKASSPVRPAEPMPTPGQDSRLELIKAVFNALDTGGNGLLTVADMRPFADQTGFNGSDQDWQQEFEQLCGEHGSREGIAVDGFAALVNDSSDEGCYCTDEELGKLLDLLLQHPPPAPAVATPKAPAQSPTQVQQDRQQDPEYLWYLVVYPSGCMH